jgi:hypothetical protein
MSQAHQDIMLRAVLSQGSDYDIAMLFLRLYPDCKDFRDKDISVILSNQVHTCFQTLARQYMEKMQQASHEELDNIHRLYRSCQEIMNFLKSHHYKKSYIAEIKMLR